MSQLAIKSHRNNQNARGCLISSILQEIFMFESPSMSVRSEVVGCFHPQFLSQNQRLVLKKICPETSSNQPSLRVYLSWKGNRWWKNVLPFGYMYLFACVKTHLFFESLQRGKRAKRFIPSRFPFIPLPKKKTSFEKSGWNCETGGICWGWFLTSPSTRNCHWQASCWAPMADCKSWHRKPFDVPQTFSSGFEVTAQMRKWWIWLKEFPVENTWSMLFVGNTHLQHSNGQWLLKTILIQHCLTPWVPTWSSSSLGFKTCAAHNHFQDANLPASFVWLPFQLSLEHDLPPNTPRFWKFHSQEWNVQMLNFKNEMHKLMCPHGESAPSCAILY